VCSVGASGVGWWGAVSGLGGWLAAALGCDRCCWTLWCRTLNLRCCAGAHVVVHMLVGRRAARPPVAARLLSSVRWRAALQYTPSADTAASLLHLQQLLNA